MITYDNLLGLPYIEGKQDCYEIIRRFFSQNFEIELPNYARPHDWWNYKLDLYMERYHKNGFSVIDVLPSQYQIGDVFLISYRSEVANHAGVLVDNGMILHHFTNRLSSIDPYRGVWRNNTVAVLRHKDVVITDNQTIVPIIDFVSPSTRRKIDAAIQSNEVPTETL